MSYETICDHNRLARIDKNFVRCLECGKSMVSQTNIALNKNEKDFVKENSKFTRNFDRNFSNVIEEVEQQKPLYEYYTDRNLANLVIVDKKVQFQSYPPTYLLTVNNTHRYCTMDEIKQLISDISAVRIDEEFAKSRFKINQKH